MTASALTVPAEVADTVPSGDGDVLHAVCCKMEVVLGGGPVIAVCGHDSTDEPLYFGSDGQEVCRECDRLVQLALASPLGCRLICPAPHQP